MLQLAKYAGPQEHRGPRQLDINPSFILPSKLQGGKGKAVSGDSTTALLVVAD